MIAEKMFLELLNQVMQKFFFKLDFQNKHTYFIFLVFILFFTFNIDTSKNILDLIIISLLYR